MAVGESGNYAGEGWQPDPSIWEDGGASDDDLEKASQEAGGEALLSDWNMSSSIGGAGGMIGGIIGGVVGLVMGLIDAGVTQQAVMTRLSEEREWREAMESELDDMRNFQTNVERNLAAMLHPLEQKFRTRAKLFGARARAQGLVGSQALAGQILAEEQYRQTVGAALPAIYKEAANETLSQQMARLREFEVKYGVQLDRDRLLIQEQMFEGQSRGNFMGGIGAGLSGLSTLAGQAIEEGIQQQQAGGQQADGKQSNADQLPGADDAFGANDIDAGASEALKTGNEGML